MFFLLRMAFWLSVVCVLLPGGGSRQAPSQSAQIDPVQAVSAAGATLADMRSFCERQPEACVVGAQVASSLGQKAQEGAKTLYEFISEKIADNKTPTERGHQRVVTGSTSGQNTLTPADLAPLWRVPLPQASPRREAQNRRPSA
ncbi:MAG: DUF5330 domain-containing protein [Hyphomicrobiales bacterium]